MSKTAFLIDASAALAVLNKETGADVVESYLTGADCYITAVNYQEVMYCLVRDKVPEPDARQAIDALAMTVVPFTGVLGADASLSAVSIARGLSLGDRCCLLTALHNGWTAVTAEKVWGKIAHPKITVIVIR